MGRRSTAAFRRQSSRQQPLAQVNENQNQGGEGAGSPLYESQQALPDRPQTSETGTDLQNVVDTHILYMLL
jgi:hypothetical protein